MPTAERYDTCIVAVLAAQTRLSVTRWTARLLRPWDLPGQNTGVGCRVLLQGIISISISVRGTWGFPDGSVVKESACNAGDAGDRFDPWVGKIAWRRTWQPTPGFWPGKSHRQKSLWLQSMGVTKSRTRLKQVRAGQRDLANGYKEGFGILMCHLVAGHPGAKGNVGLEDLRHHPSQSCQGYCGRKRGGHQEKLGGK